jgi:two-component system, OmpR family, alkaline phosphatase synthesis response regulator PhoP
MQTKTILVVDDDQDIRELICYNLAKDGDRMECVKSGEEALQRVRSVAPDLILLDLMLPGLDGLEVCKRLKAQGRTAQIPIIMLTAKGEDADVVSGLELGADDYVVKPFSPRVLLARIKAVLRRQEEGAQEDGVLHRGELVIDAARHQVTAAGKAVVLTALELRILSALARRPGLVLTRFQIVDASQGEGVGVTDRSVDVHIVSLRRKLGECGALIETVRGVGYRFKEI